MKRVPGSTWCATLLSAGILAFAPLAAASPGPARGISYQGYLTDSAGNPVNGTVSMDFAFCDDGACSSVYPLASHPSVPVVDGVYHVVLDEGGTVPAAMYTTSIWLRVAVNGETLDPPQPFTAVPFAHNADTLDGVDAAGFAASGHGHDSAYVNAAGDTMTGTLFLPANGLSVGSSQLVLSGGNVGVGTSPGSARLDVLNSTASGQAGYFRNSSASNSLPAVYGSHGGSGQAVFGYNSGTGRAGHFQIGNASSAASALVAETNGTGKAAELKGDTIVTGSLTVDGAIGGAGATAFAASAHNHDGAYINASGVDTMSGNTTGTVLTVINGNTTANSTANALYATNTAEDGRALRGLASGSDMNYGVFGEAQGSRGRGVFGFASNSGSVTNFGGLFQSNGSTGTGAEGLALGSEGTGVYGEATSTFIPTPTVPNPVIIRRGVHGKAAGGLSSDVNGLALAYGYGVEGEAQGLGFGVVGKHADGPQGYLGGSAHGVYGTAGDGGSYGVYGDDGTTGSYAGYFSGSIYVSGVVNKSATTFKIDHPLDPEHRYLYHSGVESPDMMNIYNGNVTLDEEGAAWVAMPGWFEALNMDFRYQLTAVGGPGPNLHVADEIADNRFRIAGGAAGMKVSWQVTGIRRDPWAEANRIPVEEEKPAGEVGTYLYPEGYGRAADRQASAGAVTGAIP